MIQPCTCKKKIAKPTSFLVNIVVAQNNEIHYLKNIFNIK